MRKNDFPYFKNNQVYLDNAATTQKPQSVIDVITQYYTDYCSNTHRGSYKNGNKATTVFEHTRIFVQDFIGAKSSNEIIFTKGATEGVNMVASSFVKNRFKTVIISSLEHHSNIVPWHMMGRTIGAGLEVVKYRDNLEFDMVHFEELLKNNPDSFVSITHVSNAFGVIHPVKKIVKLAHKYGAKVLIDGAQAISHFKVDVKDIGADFYLFSGHKIYGPTGVGVLYIDENSIDDFDTYQTGGAVVEKVTYDKTTLLESPLKFEAGTQNIAGVIGLGASLNYIYDVGYESIVGHEALLTDIIYKRLNSIEGIQLYTKNSECVGNISFNIEGILPIDIGLLLDKQGISVRAGHHCAMPIMDALNIDGTIRISIGIYNDLEDIDKFFKALDRAIDIIKG
ncbi:MAG: cysteine desulfurase [Spirochaetaceae bacterium]